MHIEYTVYVILPHLDQSTGRGKCHISVGFHIRCFGQTFIYILNVIDKLTRGCQAS